MCGIAGVYSLSGVPLPAFNPRQVLATLRHRGPDDEGVFLDERLFLGATRLAIIDPRNGRQPVSDEAGRFHLAMNGEIFDYDVLLAELQGRGHHFRSHCDTEVAVHLVEECWAGAIDRIDGQFAIAAYDAREKRLLLARDRMGICPLFYAVVGDYLVFASEMKAIFATGLVAPEIDRRSLDAVLAFGCVPAPRAVFRGIRSLEPGHLLTITGGRIAERVYWDIPFNDAGAYPDKPADRWAREFRPVLERACRRRLKADVPVGLYVSGGIDSATIAAMTSEAPGIRGRVFTLGFPEPGLDETRETGRIADFLGLRMHLLTYRQRDLARDLPRLIFHGESPIVSNESVPLLALAAVASKHVKVILTGEGADEALGGYEYFRWDALRQWAGGGLRGRLVRALAGRYVQRHMGPRNPFVPQPADAAYAEALFGFNPSIMSKFFYFRMLRDRVYSREMLQRQRGLPDTDLLTLPLERMRRWDPLNRTLYIASRVLMTNHLLGTHGDRAMMANSLEGRYPFLDLKVQEFLAAVPPTIKTRLWAGKFLLRRAMAHRLPREVLRRRKKMFMAPFGTPFVGDDVTDEIRDLLTPRAIGEFGYFDADRVAEIVTRLEGLKGALGRDRADCVRLDGDVIERTVLGMALNVVVSTQVLADHVRRGRYAAPASAAASPLQEFPIGETVYGTGAAGRARGG